MWVTMNKGKNSIDFSPLGQTPRSQVKVGNFLTGQSVHINRAIESSHRGIPKNGLSDPMGSGIGVKGRYQEHIKWVKWQIIWKRFSFLTTMFIILACAALHQLPRYERHDSGFIIPLRFRLKVAHVHLNIPVLFGSVQHSHSYAYWLCLSTLSTLLTCWFASTMPNCFVYTLYKWCPLAIFISCWTSKWQIFATFEIGVN